MCKIGRSRVLRVCLCSQAFVYLLVEDFDFHYLRVLVLFDGVEHSFLGETLTGLNLEVDLTLLSTRTVRRSSPPCPVGHLSSTRVRTW